ncbi:nuclear transport factor 2 family protein [Nodularia harveyana UHCC-0300]|uniref:Nuclear transport factor 2 family protein n=1 Tax=Nodularia harveyana UHCC-0300 TaxID=2974287 RepID=A0ABU5UHT3_9CYAN|nr:nuclear transport factor 2 family protein [Nodularia harveyana]MEA5583132.1 nuclear transport factor 2 family protein [Nodularia harveyana UHCC-0300]
MRLTALDRLDIIQLTATFDNAVDSENVEKYLSTFAEDGELQGFWGVTKGHSQLRAEFPGLLDSFARGRRHLLTNHEIEGEGDTARMYCYLTVFNRESNSMAGSGVFHDTLVKIEGRWYFKTRRLEADPNVMALLQSMQTS